MTAIRLSLDDPQVTSDLVARYANAESLLAHNPPAYQIADTPLDPEYLAMMMGG